MIGRNTIPRYIHSSGSVLLLLSRRGRAVLEPVLGEAYSVQTISRILRGLDGAVQQSHRRSFRDRAKLVPQRVSNDAEPAIRARLDDYASSLTMLLDAVSFG